MENNEKYIDLIIKNLTNEADEIEIQTLEVWIKEDIYNKQTFEKYKNTLNLTIENIEPEILSIDINQEWEKISGVINKYQEDTKIIELKKSKFYFWKIAAAITIFILIGGGLFYTFTSNKTTITSDLDIFETILPDGSKITLNKNSEVSYNSNFNKDSRTLKLQGEAFFEVEHNLNKSFIIEANNVFIEVVGTEFFVKTSENNTEVIVKEGKVKVYNSQTKSDTIYLTAGEKSDFSAKTDIIEKSENKEENYLSWKTKIFKFENTEFDEVIKYFEDAYNIDIELKNPGISKCRISGTFENQSLESIFSVIESFLNITIENNNNKYIIDGEGC
jgi:ferric-dicitrate binding protein FerR (iron transport regulator)